MKICVNPNSLQFMMDAREMSRRSKFGLKFIQEVVHNIKLFAISDKLEIVTTWESEVTNFLPFKDRLDLARECDFYLSIDLEASVNRRNKGESGRVILSNNKGAYFADRLDLYMSDFINNLNSKQKSVVSHISLFHDQLEEIPAIVFKCGNLYNIVDYQILTQKYSALLCALAIKNALIDYSNVSV